MISNLTIFHHVHFGRVIGHQLGHVRRHRPVHGCHRPSPKPRYAFVLSDFPQCVEHMFVVAPAFLWQSSVGCHTDYSNLQLNSFHKTINDRFIFYITALNIIGGYRLLDHQIIIFTLNNQ